LLMSNVKVLFFDVFGTLAEWRKNINCELEKAYEVALKNSDVISQELQDSVSKIDWNCFAEEWRLGYYKYMVGAAQQQSSDQWIDVDTIHSQILDELCLKYGIVNLWSKEEKAHLTMGWHRLTSFSDVPSGMRLLKKKFIVSSLSNGTVRLLVDLAKAGDMPFDVILSAQLFRAYKPNEKVYRGGASMLNVSPTECMMVAAHPQDLLAARKCGMKTAFVFRQGENVDSIESVAELGFDYVATSLTELAQTLGCL